MLPALAAIAVILRLAAGLYRGPAFFEQGYAFYTDIAASVLRGDGFCYAPGEGCAIRLPLYPALVAPFAWAGFLFPGLVVLQSVLGAVQVWLSARLGTRLFNERTGLVAAALVALNPYGIVHDSAFQDTVVFNTLVLLAAVLLIESARSGSRFAPLAAGASLGAAMLTSGRIALFVPCALAWAAFAGSAGPRTRLARALGIAAVVVLLVGAWVARNWQVAGAPVLSTETGLSLWVANNQGTLRFFPHRSIDENTRFSWDRLPREQQEALNAASEAERDRMFARMALDEILAEPMPALARAIRKVAIAFSGQLSPARDSPIQIAHAIVFVPLNILALIGLWRVRHAGDGHLLVILLFVSFAITTAIFWAHTSHGSVLHAFVMIYAASVIAPVLPRPRGRDRHPIAY